MLHYRRLSLIIQSAQMFSSLTLGLHMTFLYPSKESTKAVLSIFDQFYRISRLKLNPNKIGIFLAGVSASKTREIVAACSFKLEVLPVHYLGMPLVLGKLSDGGCKPLIDKIISKLQSWGLKNFLMLVDSSS